MNNARNIGEAQRLFHIGRQYEELGDVYHAVKLYKKSVQVAPTWGRPYFRLSLIYKARKEWKPTLYYSQKAADCDAGNKVAWWNVGIAATVLQRWESVRKAWQQLGHTSKPTPRMQAIELHVRNFREVVWTKPLDMVRVRIESIPHPFSGRRYGEVILHECESVGNIVAAKQAMSVYKEVQRLERSFFDTYSVIIHTESSADIDILDKLCLEAELGFDNWSNTNELHLNKQRTATPEYYMKRFFDKGTNPPQHSHLIGIAAKRKTDVLDVLEAWRVISLGAYSQLEKH